MRVVPSAKEAATARTGYSSIIEAAREAGTRTPLSLLERTVMSPTSSPPSERRLPILRSAPISSSVSRSPVRVGLSITVVTVTSESGVMSAATIGNAAELGSAGTAMRLGLEFVAAGQRDVARRPVLLDLELRAEGLEHAFGVIARGGRAR